MTHVGARVRVQGRSRYDLSREKVGVGLGSLHPRLVIWGDLEAFVTECWLAKRGLLVRVEEGGISDVVRRTLCASYCWDATMDWGFRRRLSIDLAEDLRREACVNKVPLGVVVLFTSPF